MIAELLLAAVMAAATPSTTEITPPRLVSGGPPVIPAAMVAGGEVFLELTVDFDGRVAAVRTLRTTPPLTSLVSAAARLWRFTPSSKTTETVSGSMRCVFQTTRFSRVLVAAVFRAPTVAGPTLGSPPADLEAPDVETPYPVAVSMPPGAPHASAAGVVLAELRVEADGAVSDARLIGPPSPFDGTALEAAREFRFRAARVDGTPVPAYAYVLFGFPLPITVETIAVPAHAQTLRTTPPLGLQSMHGRDLYMFYCASCHGRDGKGHGAVAAALKTTPPDLTRLTRQNSGVFPRARLEAIVTGRADPPLPVYGTREMPVWGPIFRSLDSHEAMNQQRIANILDYVESLQARYAARRATRQSPDAPAGSAK